MWRKKILQMKKEKLKSSVPGLVYLSSRDNPISFGDGFLEGRRLVDGAENLWRINNRLYDLEKFMNNHPGGAEWLSLTRGTDITELFEVNNNPASKIIKIYKYKFSIILLQTHHLSKKPENMLPKFYIRDAVTPRSVPMTFKKYGFYKRFKERAFESLKNIDYHSSSLKTNLLADTILLLAFLFCLLSAVTQSIIISISAGLFFFFYQFY